MSTKEIAVMTELQSNVKLLEKLLERIGKTPSDRRKKSTVEVYEAERAELWEKIVSHNNKIIAAQPPAEYQEKIKLFKEINRKIKSFWRRK